MNWARAAAALAMTIVALVFQVSVFPELTDSFGEAVTPNLCLLVVVGAALARGPQFAMVLGFGAGLLLDLAPPADHAAGRWALALVVVGYLAGRIKPDVKPTATAVLVLAGAMSFVGTSTFALSGVLLGDLDAGVGGLLRTIGIALLWDLLLTPFVLPVVLKAFDRLEPARATA